MKVYVVYYEAMEDGFSIPLKAFSTALLAKNYCDKQEYPSDYDWEELEVEGDREE